ncbi:MULTISPECIES: hypothetical protein [unclassified Neorhizobium]|uniref:hypothetical protein n=1 Tax=unclassified Neorhizobium TaxID=2629175 RepID=UPI001FF6266D|nr:MULTISPECIES: hypothetical protein [unclassified Neorhizobium]MCJ9668599.1 hypothetical protein [Neorhizobium sp. SHOUNA12B]MCJ9744302.1 hypothetical protein [Neorhizobium sp. SHOUNA12A]
MNQKPEKRRNCADRARAEVMTRKIHRRKKFDPAMSVFIKLLGLTSFMINLFPAFGQVAAEPLPEPPRPVQVPVSLPEPEPRTYKRAPSWPLLMRDLARPVAHDMARAEVYARLPVECRPWLDAVFRDADWSAIRPYAHSGATDEEVGAGVFAAFRAWKADQDEKARKAKKDATGGKAGAGAKPGGGDDGPDDDDDDREVKP